MFLLKQPFKYYLFFAYIALAFTLLFQGYNDFVWSYALPLIQISLVYFIYVRHHHRSEKKFILAIFLWALLIRITAVVIMSDILIYYNGMPFLSFKDDYQYHHAAIDIMKRWEFSGWGFYDDLAFSSDTYSGFPNFSAALMSIFNSTSHFVPRIGNAVLSSLTCLIAYIIIRDYTDLKKAHFVGILLATLPLTTTIAAMQFKDTLLLFFITIGLYASISIVNNKKILFSIILLIISYVGCSFGRPAVIIPMAAALIIMISLSVFSNKQGHIFVKVLSLLAISFLLLYSYQKLGQMGFTDIDMYFESRYESLSTTEIQDSQANVKNMSIADYLGAPLYFIMGLFLPPPLLVEIDNSINYSTWAVLAHYAYLPFLVVAMWKSIIHRKEYPIPFFLFIVYLFLRIGQANSLMTSFSPRQSLATLFIMYLILPMYDKGLKKIEYIVIGLSLVSMFTYNIVRLVSHGMM